MFGSSRCMLTGVAPATTLPEPGKRQPRGPSKKAVRMGRIDYGRNREWAHSVVSFDQVPFVFAWHKNRTSKDAREGIMAAMTTRKGLADLVLEVVPWQVVSVKPEADGQLPMDLLTDQQRVTFVMLGNERSIANFLFHVLSPIFRRDCHFVEVIDGTTRGQAYRKHLEQTVEGVSKHAKHPLLVVYSPENVRSKGPRFKPVVWPGPFNGKNLRARLLYHRWPMLPLLHHHNADELCHLGPKDPDEPTPDVAHVCIGILGNFFGGDAPSDEAQKHGGDPRGNEEAWSRLHEIAAKDSDDNIGVQFMAADMEQHPRLHHWLLGSNDSFSGVLLFAVHQSEDGTGSAVLQHTSGTRDAGGYARFIKQAMDTTSDKWRQADSPMQAALEEFEIDVPFDYMKLVWLYLMTPKVQIFSGLTIAMSIIYNLAWFAHARGQHDQDGVLIRNIFNHWVSSAPGLAKVTAKLRGSRLKKEKQERKEETLKQRRERLKREEEQEEEEDEYSAPPAVVAAFEMFDGDEDGAIGKQDLKAVAERIGADDDDELFQEMIEALDVDGKGEVSLVEFHMMTESKQVEAEDHSAPDI